MRLLRTTAFWLMLLLVSPTTFSESVVDQQIDQGMALQKSVECLAKNIYYEARGEGYLGMLAVAHVTVNRTQSSKYPDDVCSVVYQRGQFTWTVKPGKINDQSLLDKAKKIAYDVLFGLTKDPTHGSTHFHNADIDSPWTKRVRARIGNHIFY